jgi:hypothetical protein
MIESPQNAFVGRAGSPSRHHFAWNGLPARPTIGLAVLLVLISGCSDGRPERVPISGRVTIDGHPVTKGYIILAPDGARSAQGRIDSEGRFTLGTFDETDGAVVGKHRVGVISRDVLSPTKIRWLAPQKYVDPRYSNVEVTIDGPTDSLAIELTWDGGKPFVEETQTQGDSDPAAVGKSGR